jgi:hypothetical protein
MSISPVDKEANFSLNFSYSSLPWKLLMLQATECIINNDDDAKKLQNPDITAEFILYLSIVMNNNYVHSSCLVG